MCVCVCLYVRVCLFMCAQAHKYTNWKGIKACYDKIIGIEKMPGFIKFGCMDFNHFKGNVGFVDLI